MKTKLIFLLSLLVASSAFASDPRGVASTSNCHDIIVRNSSTGAGLTGIAYNAASLYCKYKRSDQSGSGTAITLVDGTVGTFVSSGWKEVGNGIYQICPPNAAYTSGKYVDVWCGGAASMQDPVGLRVPLSMDVNIFSATNDSLGRLAFAPDGTVQTSGSNDSTHAVLASSESYADNAINGRQLCITSGNGYGNCRRITGYVSATKVATVSRAFTATPDNTTKYVVGSMAEDFDAAGAELTSCPSGTATLRDQIMLAYMIARNKITQSATEWKLHRDDGSTVLCTKAVTPGATFTVGEGS